MTSDEGLPDFLVYFSPVIPDHSVHYFGGSDPGEIDLGIRVCCFIYDLDLPGCTQ